MKCKTCSGKGMLLKMIEAVVPDDLPDDIKEIAKAGLVSLEAVTCDCCGGWAADGLDCENCQAESEGKSRLIVWIDETEKS